MSTSIYDWSQTAASNSNADAAINWAEGQAAAGVNDSARAMMAAVARNRDDTNGTLATTGAANAYAATANTAYASLQNGLRLTVKANFSNTGACTFNLTPNGGAAFGAKAIRIFTADSGEIDPVSGQIQNNGHYILEYDSSANSAAGAWILLNPAAAPSASGAWSSYSPTISAGSGTITTSSAVFSYQTVGKAVFFNTRITITTNGTGGSYVICTLPATPRSTPSQMAVSGFKSGSPSIALYGQIDGGTANVKIYAYDGTYPVLVNGDILVLSGVYESV